MRARIAFETQDIPVANEFLLNLLLTGRIRDNLIYLLKLLLPPVDWLSYYYGTRDQNVLRRRGPGKLIRTQHDATHRFSPPSHRSEGTGSPRSTNARMGVKA